MKCANSYCIHNESLKCALDEISLDFLGMCEACVIEYKRIPRGKSMETESI